MLEAGSVPPGARRMEASGQTRETIGCKHVVVQAATDLGEIVSVIDRITHNLNFQTPNINERINTIRSTVNTVKDRLKDFCDADSLLVPNCPF